jgi:hypothetical protein
VSAIDFYLTPGMDARENAGRGPSDQRASELV